MNSKFPLFLWWGKDLIRFYNDAYRPSLGNSGKHPEALDATGTETWGEIWDYIKPLIDRVLAGGEASWDEDRLLPIFRNGGMEDVYWTFSYNPVIDESGKPAKQLGALCFVIKPDEYNHLKKIIRTVLIHLETGKIDMLCDAVHRI